MKRLIDRAGWALAGALGLMLMLVAARAIQAGPLDPPGPVASTLKTLGDLPPSWHQILLANNGPDTCHSSRFTCVMNNEAVLDNETGLVWQRDATVNGAPAWAVADANCETSLTGGRRGWRLPGPNELGSLGNTATGLPAGHPFTASAGSSWTSAPSPFDPASIVTIDPTTSFTLGSSALRNSAARAWCVRGAGSSGTDAQSPFPEIWRATQLPANDGASATQSSRFKAIDGAASVVVDRETGLAWQVTPAATASAWAAAINACTRFSSIATGLGWRLPTLAEQLSLYTSAGTGTLPTGHPFVGITGVYWTSTTDAGVAAGANANTVDTTQVETSTSLLKTTATPRHWCVRGGPGD
jgi:hypothetical protein